MPYTEIADALTELGDDLATEADAAVKAGARNSAADQALIQQVYDAAEDICQLALALGANDGEEDEEDDDAVELLEDGKSVSGAALAAWLDGDAIKLLDGDRVGGYAVRFGTEDEHDISHMRDFFTKSTDYWIDAWDRRPMLYHHAMDASTADAPRVGTWLKATIDDAGVWLEGQLDRAHKYHAAIKELVRRGALKLSSDSAPHLVVRERRPSGANEVKRWPILAASLTPTPAEPRLAAVSLKAISAEIGADAIDVSPQAQDGTTHRHDGAKAADDRARRLLLEIDLAMEDTA